MINYVLFIIKFIWLSYVTTKPVTHNQDMTGYTRLTSLSQNKHNRINIMDSTTIQSYDYYNNRLLIAVLFYFLFCLCFIMGFILSNLTFIMGA